MMKPAEKIWLDGQLVPWEQATVHVTAHALHYGSSVFEGIRAYALPNGPAVLCLDEHLDRLWGSCKVYRLEIPYDRATIRQAILDTIRVNRHTACYIRPIVFRGTDTFSVNGLSCPTHLSIITVEMGRYLGPEAIKQGNLPLRYRGRDHPGQGSGWDYGGQWRARTDHNTACDGILRYRGRPRTRPPRVVDPGRLV